MPTRGDAFQELQDVVLGRIQIPSDTPPGDEYHRLYTLLQGPAHAAGTADLVSLVRDVLRRETARQQGITQELTVPGEGPGPSGHRWPPPSGWEAVGVRAYASGGAALRIQADEWMPAWLAGSRARPPAAAAVAKRARRTFEPVPRDPVLSLLGRESYRCPAQREMARAVLSAPPGSTLLCNLPTGAGKSLLAHLPAVLRAIHGGVSVIVVPTTALALDQAHGFGDFVSHETAYYEDGTVPGEERRREIRRRIKEGTQRVVFASPESVCGSLSGPLYLAAQRGLFRLLAIDEAHIVDQWGDDFRSDFQELAGLRRDLLRSSPGDPFVTLLLTATLTEPCLETLETMFGAPGPFAVQSAVQLRPEPAYWASECPSREVQEERVIEAIRHLPRPLILYTSKVEDSNAWDARLRQEGFRRVAVVTGGTRAAERRRVIERWKAAELDVVVATSAFGLGMDQADVRAVVHACIPESVDRFYQEVGRGGRDGNASISLLVAAPEDRGTAETLSQKTLIGVEKGLSRWRRMFGANEPLGSSTFRVPVTISPGLTEDRIDMTGELNEAWNVRTLTLLSRARILELDASAPPQFAGDGETEDEAAVRFAHELAKHRSSRVVRVLRQEHTEASLWAQVVEPLRKRTAAATQANLARMFALLKGERCVAEIFEEAYSVRRPAQSSGPGHEAIVAKACGGCAACRAAGREPFAETMPIPMPAWPASWRVGEGLTHLFGAFDAATLFYEELTPGTLTALVRWGIALGIRSVVVPPDLRRDLRAAVLDGMQAVPGVAVFLYDAFHERRSVRVPTLVIHTHTEAVPKAILPRPRERGWAPRLLLLPKNVADPVADHRMLRDVIRGWTRPFQSFLSSQGL